MVSMGMGIEKSEVERGGGQFVCQLASVEERFEGREFAVGKVTFAILRRKV
jgi:hypothetical protein